MLRGATFDPTGAYRYHLWREWDGSLTAITFVMLNPSTADAEQDDPTIRRCIGFARDWGYGRLEVVNLFARRTSSPRELALTADPVGVENARLLERATRRDAVFAWGNIPLRLGPAAEEQRGALQAASLADARCLGLTALGEPRHPLYLPRTTVPIPLIARMVIDGAARVHCGARLQGADQLSPLPRRKSSTSFSNSSALGRSPPASSSSSSSMSSP